MDSYTLYSLKPKKKEGSTCYYLLSNQVPDLVASNVKVL